MARSHCLYCGAALPAELSAAAAGVAIKVSPSLDPERGPAAHQSAGAAERLLLILDLTSTEREHLTRALRIGNFEADQRLRRGGFELLRIADAAAITDEQARLAADGLRVATVPEGEARVRPAIALGGARHASALALRTDEGPLTVTADEIFFVTRGPIVREYQPSPRRQRFVTSSLETGYRIHLHRRASPRAVELDPGAFEFGQAMLASSSLLELTSWVEELLPGVPSDDSFRRLPPALAPSAPDRGVVAAAKALARPPVAGRSRRGEPRRILDNLEQFRFYSAWRAALERRRLPS